MTTTNDSTAKAVWSSGVPFFPPSTKYWRIGGKWYDLEPFLDKHPGGRQVLLMARDRFEDCTFVFEAHHHNYARARAIIRKFEVSEELATELNAHAKVYRLNKEKTNEFQPISDENALNVPMSLLDDSSFYSVLRKKATKYLREQGCPSGGPTWSMCILFWIVMCGFVASYVNMYREGSTLSAAILGIFSAWAGGFGHNWIHQPQYRAWAYLSLDTLWFSSDSWYRDHVLQHHMYTQTAWDNHLHGSDPFMPTNPTMARTFFEKYLFAYIHPFFLTFGPIGNWIAQTVAILKGQEQFRFGRLVLPVQVMAMVYAWGLHGVWLMYVQGAVLGVYYFTLALMNHNDERVTSSVDERNAAKDWGEAQVHSSADWATNLTWWQSLAHMFLNYHTVHHLFPRIDACHFPALHAILTETCQEFDIEYYDSNFLTVYKGLYHSLSTPLSLAKQIQVYGGAL